jgi:Domain of unknown function (DUF4382)
MRRFVLLCLAAGAVACGAGSGQVKLSLTDTPADLVNVSHVNITLDEIRVHDDASSSVPDGGPNAAQDGVDGPGWIVLCTDTQTVDLMQLTNGRFTPLCTQATADGGIESRPIEVPAGRISQLRLHVVSAQLVFNDGTPPASLTVPSGPTSGLKINVDQDVPKGGVLDLKLDFNAASSINRTGTGTYILTPVLSVLP